MPAREFEFTLDFAGVSRLTSRVADAFFAAGCADATIGVRDGSGFADFCRTAETFAEAVVSAINAIEGAKVKARVTRVRSGDWEPLTQQKARRPRQPYRDDGLEHLEEAALFNTILGLRARGSRAKAMQLLSAVPD